MDPNPGEEIALATALKRIRDGWVFGILSGLGTLVLVFLATTGHPVYGINLSNYVDVVAVFGLSYGIYRRSRACAVILLADVVIGKCVLLPKIESYLLPGTIISSLIFIYVLSMAVWGAFAYHRIIRDRCVAAQKQSSEEERVLAVAMLCIRIGWIASVVFAVNVLGSTVWMLTAHPLFGYSLWSLMDVLIALGFAYGIYRRSRICAVILIIYTVVAKYFIFSKLDPAVIPGPLFLSILYLVCYGLGAWGTITFHRIVDREGESRVQP